MDNKTKEKIIDRLYETSSHCSHCGADKCGHSRNRTLNKTLDVNDVLRAINLDEYFYPEED